MSERTFDRKGPPKNDHIVCTVYTIYFVRMFPQFQSDSVCLGRPLSSHLLTHLLDAPSTLLHASHGRQ